MLALWLAPAISAMEATCVPHRGSVSPHMSCRTSRLGMTAATSVDISIEEAISLFGRLADAQHVFSEPIRTAASGFEFSANTAIKPKWLIAYATRESCGEDVDMPPHTTRWASLLFPDGASACDRDSFDAALCSAEFAAPLGTPKWAVPGEVLVDMKTAAATPSQRALSALWTALGRGADLQRDAVIATLRTWAKSDDLNEAVLFSEFKARLEDAAST